MLHTNKPPYLGAAYYPELWPAEQVDQDIRQMKETGLKRSQLRITDAALRAVIDGLDYDGTPGGNF